MNLKNLNDTAVKAVKQAVERGLDERITEEYILRFSDLLKDLELDLKYKPLLYSYALDALRRHPEVKEVILFDDIDDKAFISFHTPFCIGRRLFKILNNIAPAIVSGSESYAQFVSPKDMTRLIELERTENNDSCVTISQTVQSGGHRAVDIRMEIMVDTGQSMAKSVSFYRAGVEKETNLCVYENDGAINHRTEDRLNRFLSDWLSDIQKLGFKEKQLNTGEDLEINTPEYTG